MCIKITTPTISFFGLFLILIIVGTQVFSQEGKPSTNWDNQVYIGNKVAGAKGDWRFSGELQVRLKDNMQSLDNWFVEGVATFLLSKTIEIIPD